MPQIMSYTLIPVKGFGRAREPDERHTSCRFDLDRRGDADAADSPAGHPNDLGHPLFLVLVGLATIAGAVVAIIVALHPW